MTTLKDLKARSGAYKNFKDEDGLAIKETFTSILNKLLSDSTFKYFMRKQYSFVCAGLETELNQGFIKRVERGLSKSDLIFTDNSVAYSVFEDNIFQTISIDLLSFAIFHEGLINLEESSDD